MAPPQLPTNTPVVNVLQPIIPHFFESLWQNRNVSSTYCVDCLLAHALHAHEPLRRHHGLDHLPSPLAARHALCVRLGLQPYPAVHQVLPQLLPTLLSSQAGVLRATVVVDGGVLVHDADHGQVVALAQLVVVGVVGGGDFQGTGPEFPVHILIRNHWDEAISGGHLHLLADQVFVPLVLGMHAHSRVSQNRLRARRGDGNKHLRISIGVSVSGEYVLEVVEFALLLAVLHLQVAHRGLQMRTPVDQVVAPVDEAPLVQALEGLGHGRAHVVL
mmetsp:Transcript_7294/g.12273  ORF Transcript_7294/g.12273 Transcript_7294/m.12273 type:complete len:273 (+) Transcript_7294:1807-2625(+)